MPARRLPLASAASPRQQRGKGRPTRPVLAEQGTRVNWRSQESLRAAWCACVRAKIETSRCSPAFDTRCCQSCAEEDRRRDCGFVGIERFRRRPDASPFRRIAASEPAPKEADSVAAIVAEYVDALISDRHLTSVQRERSLPRAFLLGGTHMACLCRRACPCGPRRRRYRGF